MHLGDPVAQGVHDELQHLALGDLTVLPHPVTST